MTLMELVLLLFVAGLCGALGQAVAGYSRGGCLSAVAVGFIGALLGRWLAGALGLPSLFVVTVGGSTFPIVWSIAGGALFVAVLSVFARKRVVVRK